ncbi:hypothetical protein PRIPAC_75899 [Pristionchus pacificus]|uniref:RNA binding protein n=1 Tax=Pristionchus pacificus TaxID=54126 RepID=A0A2A6C8W6_PRIPA|nr:hypothetical protein PRIPAC_75899 [Pristionchus pacificus]|eukprot:PDM74540.1 RNA binding protein [Pristionchus pacificus]
MTAMLVLGNLLSRVRYLLYCLASIPGCSNRLRTHALLGVCAADGGTLSSSLASVTLSPLNNDALPSSTSGPRPTVFSTNEFNPDLPGPTAHQQNFIKRYRTRSYRTPLTAPSPPTTSTVYIGNVRESMCEQELFELFSIAGEVDAIALPIDRVSGAKRGFGFCKFVDASSAQNAVDLLNGHDDLLIRLKI